MKFEPGGVANVTPKAVSRLLDPPLEGRVQLELTPGTPLDPGLKDIRAIAIGYGRFLADSSVDFVFAEIVGAESGKPVMGFDKTASMGLAIAGHLWATQ